MDYGTATPENFCDETDRVTSY